MVLVFILLFSPADATLTLDNVMTVVEGVQDWEDLASLVQVPWNTQGIIKRRYSTEYDRKKAMSEYFLTCAPNATWPTIAGKLYRMGETAALERAKKYFQRPSGTDIITIVFDYIYIGQYMYIQRHTRCVYKPMVTALSF